MDKIIICEQCGAEIELTYNRAPGSFTETDICDCPECGHEVYREKCSGYYTVKTLKKGNVSVKKESNKN